MPNIQCRISRASIVCAALLSLAVLAGCQSESSLQTGAADSQAGSGVTTATPTSGPAGQDLEGQMRAVGDRVYFALDRYDLGASAEATLQQQAALLQRHPEAAVTIQGHADERGTREYNLALGERRADTARNFLMALGIPG
jgi:peptidoglycan-associated lipoprotein